MSGKENEEEKKTTVALPVDLMKQLKLRCAESGAKEKHVLRRALGLFLGSSLDFNKSYLEAVFSLQLSPDPEDRIEVALAPEALLMLHQSIHEGITKSGLPVEEQDEKAVDDAVERLRKERK